HTTGLAMLLMGVLLHALDGAGASAPRRWWMPLARAAEVFGKNALFVFVLSGLVPRALALLRWADGVDANGLPRFTSPLPWAYRTLFADLGSDPRLGSLAVAIANLAVYWALARWLDRRGVYIRV
ncbi:MAG: DUF5009 domain-containing protein, partial [Burkholderiales bacterium PBB5]